MKNVAYFGFSVARESSHRPGEILIRRPKIFAQEMGLEVKALFPMDSWSLQFPAAHGAMSQQSQIGNKTSISQVFLEE